MNKKDLNAETLDLNKIGWNESRSEEEVFSYYKAFFKENYSITFTDRQLEVIDNVIDDLLTKYSTGDLTND